MCVETLERGDNLHLVAALVIDWRPMEVLINIDVDDLDRAMTFYRRALDLHPVRRFDDDFVELGGAGTRIFLLRKSAGSRAVEKRDDRRHYRRHWTPVHLDFVVPDLQHALARALDAGAVPDGEIVTESWCRFAVLGDPFGHGFCLIEFIGAGYDDVPHLG